MGDLLEEARAAVRCLLENLRPVTAQHPKELTSIAEFNHMLGLAKAVCLQSPTIQGMPEFARHASTVDLLTRLSALHGALTTSHAARPVS